MDWIRRCSLVSLIAIASLAPAAPPVKVETEVSPRQKKPDQPPARVWPDTRVGRLLKELEDLQRANKLGEDPWARKLREIINVGPEAVPELIAALDETPATDRRMLRTLPYLLRGIGDRRAVPALIRAIPRCLGSDGSDMGYHTADPELLAFLSRNDAGFHRRPANAPPDTHYSYGRPIREVCETLEAWTKMNHGWLEINFISIGPSTSPRQRWLQQKLYNQCAERWATWWSQHWSEHVADPAWSRVDLKLDSPAEVPSPFLDLSRPLKHEGGRSNCFAEPFMNRKARDVFLDLDTGRSSGLPPEWKSKSDAELRDGEESLVAWAREQGFDLMGVERVIDGKPRLMIRPIQLDIWEVPSNFWDQQVERTGQQYIDSGRWCGKELIHWNSIAAADEPDAPGIFFYVTTDGTPGLFHLGVPVFKAGSAPDDNSDLELRTTGERRGRRYGTRALTPSEQP
ncbi:hypothetical protein AYO47_06955 [Planctomyces sp. SCGC AG-212-M04]|nr:hypothetical protein AYO47_06955 [Planctomyces sp. SCGC AG-212-M04]